MKQKKIGFIGLGLIGGSIARAIRRYYPDYEIIAFDNNKETLAQDPKTLIKRKFFNNTIITNHPFLKL